MITAADVSMVDSMLLSLLGFSIVFIVLIALILVIKVISSMTRKIGAPNTAEASATVSFEAGKVPAGNFGGLASDETTAMLMAVVACETNTPLNELQFISIKNLEGTT